MPQLAAGSVAVITGGASGFGYQMALQLQEIGLHIALLDWNLKFTGLTQNLGQL